MHTVNPATDAASTGRTVTSTFAFCADDEAETNRTPAKAIESERMRIDQPPM
jgi:hypothetical protein